VPENLVPRRTPLGYLAWGATALAAAVNLAHAIRRGTGWGAAAGGVLLFVLYAILPRIEAASRRKRSTAVVTIDDHGVTRTDGELRESVAWDDLAWVRIFTTSAGPAVDDVFFALGAGNGKGCLVPLELATSSHLLEALQQRLPGLDNAAVAQAMGSTTEAVFTIWKRPDAAKAAPDQGALS